MKSLLVLLVLQIVACGISQDLLCVQMLHFIQKVASGAIEVRPRRCVLALITQPRFPLAAGFRCSQTWPSSICQALLTAEQGMSMQKPQAGLKLPGQALPTHCCPREPELCTFRASCSATKTLGWAIVLRICPPRSGTGARVSPRVVPAAGG